MHNYTWLIVTEDGELYGTDSEHQMQLYGGQDTNLVVRGMYVKPAPLLEEPEEEEEEDFDDEDGDKDEDDEEEGE